MADEVCRLYENPALREALGDVLRPGGLALTDEALAASGLGPGARVLDVGCGTGATVAHLRRHGLDAVGVDASTLLLAAGRAREPALPLLLARGEHLPVGDELFDAVLAECSLSVMTGIDVALAEFRRVLKPGGRLILSDLYTRTSEGPAWAKVQQPASCPGGILSKSQITNMLAETGFDLAIWQDRSGTLKVLAARLILAGASPAQFWSATCRDTPGAFAGQSAGYFWLVARKREQFEWSQPLAAELNSGRR